MTEDREKEEEQEADTNLPGKERKTNGPIEEEDKPKTTTLSSSSQRVQNQLNIIFLFFFAGGVAGAFYESWYIPAGAIVAYFLIGLRITKNQINQDKFADSLYYMGFLLTLWALFFGLGLYAPSVEQLDSAKITRQFGIALITTVLGLMFRIVLIQFRRTVSDQEEEAREGISIMVNALMAEIETAIAAVRETKERLTAEAGEAVTAGYSEVTSKIRHAGEGVEQATHSLKDKIEAVDIDPELLTKKLRPAAEQLSSEVQDAVEAIGSVTANMKERIESIDIDPNLLANQIRPATSSLTDEIESATAAIRQATESMEKSAHQSTKGLSGIQRNAEGLSDGVQSLAAALKEAGDSVAGLRSKGKEAATGIEQLLRAAGQFESVVSRQQKNLQKALTDYDSNVARAAAEFDEVSNEAATSVTALKDTVVESVDLLRDEIMQESERNREKK